MGCFLVPATEAAVVTVITKVTETRALKKKETGITETEKQTAISFTDKVKWLRNLLWGGSGLLAFEHIWHGEVTPWFPFLTAAGNQADMMEMLKEMSTVGVGMAVIITAVWGLMLLGSSHIEKRASEEAEAGKQV